MNDFWNDPSARMDRSSPAAPPKRRFRKRWIVFGLLGAFVLLLILVPKPTPEQRAADKAQAAADKAKATADEARKSEDAKATLTSEVKTLWGNVVAGSKACDVAAENVASAARSGDRYALYGAATAGSEACRKSYNYISDLDAPASSAGDVEDAFETGIQTCASAQVARQIAFDKLAKVADGDVRPSAMSEAREAMDTAGAGGLACAGGMIQAAGKAGVDHAVFNVAK